MSDTDADIVIGSGPAGVSAAGALLARGRRVLMIDGGASPEAPLLRRRDALAARPPEAWSAAEIAAYQRPQLDAPAGRIRRFGSDFALAPAETVLGRGADEIALRSSRAVGGLSNLWGAAVLPWRQQDMRGWPVSAEDLAPHYAAVARFMPVAGRADALEALFPAFAMQGRAELAPGPQAGALLEAMNRRQAALGVLGIVAGAARVAVDAARCRACGMCLHGCPWGLIWSAAQRVRELRECAGFSHQGGRVALCFSETPAGVELRLAGGGLLRGRRLFIAAGVLETARLLLASRPERDAGLVLHDSQHALLPLLQRRGNRRRPDRGPRTTLPQLFLELDSADVSPFTVHSQIYAWNEFFAHDMVRNFGRSLAASRPLFAALARRLVVAQIFLHSEHSARIGLRLAADGRLTATVQRNPATGAVMRAAQRRIARALSLAGLSALGFARRDGAPGSSFHAGASLPMASRPRDGQSDLLGRPHGLTRVHVVDASVLPAIPATTITFPVMANAHRIASSIP